MDNDLLLNKQKKISIKLCKGVLWKQIQSSLGNYDANHVKKNDKNLSSLIVDIDLKGISRKNENGKSEKKTVKRLQENSGSQRRFWIIRFKNALPTRKNKKRGNKVSNALDQILNLSKPLRKESISKIVKENKIEASIDAPKILQSKRLRKNKLKHHDNFKQNRSLKKSDCVESYCKNNSSTGETEKVIEICNAIYKMTRESHSVNKKKVKNNLFKNSKDLKDFIVASVRDRSSRSEMLIAHIKDCIGLRSGKDYTNDERNDEVKQIKGNHQDKCKKEGKILNDKEPYRSKNYSRMSNDTDYKKKSKSADAYPQKILPKVCSKNNINENEKSLKFHNRGDYKSSEDLCLREEFIGKRNKYAFGDKQINNSVKIKRDDQVTKKGRNRIVDENNETIYSKEKILEIKPNKNHNTKCKEKSCKQKFYNMIFCLCQESLEDKSKNRHLNKTKRKRRQIIERKVSKMFRYENYESNNGQENKIDTIGDHLKQQSHEIVTKSKNIARNRKYVKINNERNDKNEQCNIPVTANYKSHYERKGISQNDNVNDKNDVGKRKDFENFKRSEKAIRKYEDLKENSKQEKSQNNSTKKGSKYKHLINGMEQEENKIKYKNMNIEKLKNKVAKYSIDLEKDKYNCNFATETKRSNYACNYDSIILGNSYQKKSTVRQNGSRENFTKSNIKDSNKKRNREEKLNKINEKHNKEQKNSYSSGVEEYESEYVEERQINSDAEKNVKKFKTSKSNKEFDEQVFNDSLMKKFKVFVLVDRNQNEIYYKHKRYSETEDCDSNSNNIYRKQRVKSSKQKSEEPEDSLQENQKRKSARRNTEKNHSERLDKNETVSSKEKRKPPPRNTDRKMKSKVVTICEELSHLSCDSNREEELYPKQSKDKLRTKLSTTSTQSTDSEEDETIIAGNKKEIVLFNKSDESSLDESQWASINRNGIFDSSSRNLAKRIRLKYLKWMSLKKKRSSRYNKELLKNNEATSKHDNVKDETVARQSHRVQSCGESISSSVDNSEERLTANSAALQPCSPDDVACSCGYSTRIEKKLLNQTKNASSTSSIEFIRSFSGNLIMCTLGKKHILSNHIHSHNKTLSSYRNKKKI